MTISRPTLARLLILATTLLVTPALSRAQSNSSVRSPELPAPLATSSVHQEALPARAADAAWTGEVAVGAALGHVYRFEDQTFGNRPNVMVAAGAHHRSGFGVEFEFDRTFGLTPRPAPCGILIDGLPAACVGDARDGIESVTIAAFDARYEFRGRKLRPYLFGGLGILRSRSVWSTARVDGKQVVLTEDRMVDTGFGPDLGAGFRLDLSPRVSFRPEVRWLDASVKSRLNLGVARVGAFLAYRW